jgi:hypothetical protein
MDRSIRLIWILIVFAACWAAPAHACYTGPVPVGFRGETAQLSGKGKIALSEYVEMRGLNRQNRLLVIFYGGTSIGAANKALRKKREQAIRAFLAGNRVPANAILIAASTKHPPDYLRDINGGVRPRVTVELTAGCGG